MSTKKMKTFAATTMFLTTALAGSAFAGAPKGMVEDPKALDGLLGTKLAKEILGYEGPVIDTLDPGPHCKDIDAGHSFSEPFYQQSVAGVPFTIGASGDIGLVADATKFGAEASIGPSVELFGQSVRPLDYRFSATADSSGLNSIDFSIYAFGFELGSTSIANTTNAINYTRSFGWSLPNVLSGSLGKTYNCTSDFGLKDCSVSWSLTSNVAANVAGVVIFGISHTGVEARALLGVNANASLSATGSAGADIPHLGHATLSLGATGSFDVIHALFGGRALLQPYNSYYVADAAASFSVSDSMQGLLAFHIAEPIDEDFTIFSLTGTAYADDWAYSCTFPKQF